MIDKETAQAIGQQVHTLWIEPELKKRWGESGIPKDFKIRTCLVRLPIGAPPIVEFNNEVRWLAQVKVAEGCQIEEGQDVFLHHIVNIKTVQPPEVDGKRVAFVFMYHTGHDYSIVFDFSPNSDSGDGPLEWSFGEAIADYLRLVMVERAVNVDATILKRLKDIGLWPAPALLPYPISGINKLLEDGDRDGAKRLLVQHCTPDFLGTLVNRWTSIPAFKMREVLFQDTLQAHRDGKFSLSIYTLLPQIEGIVTDWLYTHLPSGDVPFRQESKTKKFRDVLTNKQKTTLIERKVAETALDFILTGPVLQTFEQWQQAIDAAFPGRHILGHGKYDPALLTEENSVKVFLLLDTVWKLITGAPAPGA